MPDLTRLAVETWIKTIATGEFHYKQVLDGIVKPIAYNKLRKIMYDLCKAGVCESVGRKDGIYRPIEEEPQPVDFSNVEGHTDFPIVLPFDLRKYVFIYPETASIVAGSKGAAKTGFLYRTAVLNMNNINTILLSNMEGGREQMVDRFEAMGIDLASCPLKVFPVFDNFHDLIKHPDTIYLIDYIDAPEGTEFYMIGGLISKIRKKLVEVGHSVAVIGLQKPRGRDTAFGGEGTLKEATLYLAMDTNKIKIVDAKVPANPRIIPKNMAWSFRYSEAGTNFLNVTPIGEVTELEEQIPF